MSSIESIERPNDLTATVQLKNGSSITLKACDLAIATDVAFYAATNEHKAAVAALGACWVGKHRPKVSYAASKGNVWDYASKVQSVLMNDKKMPFNTMLEVSFVAFDLIVRQVHIVQDAVDKAGFLEETSDMPTTES